MNYRLFSFLVIFAASLFSAITAEPQGRLFRFERSKNRNYICYDVQQQNGQLNIKDPIHIYWIRVEEGGGQKELSFVQRKLAFGYKVVERGNNEVTIHLTAYDKLLIRICLRDGKWIALANIGGEEAQLTRLYAQMRSPNSLHVEYVDLFGRSLSTGKDVKHRIKNTE